MAESDLDATVAALASRRSACAGLDDGHRSPRANKRATLGLVLVGLLVAAVIDLSLSSPSSRDTLAKDSRASTGFSNAESGACLNWPVGEPDKPSFVQCSDDHMFEVAKSVVMNNFAEPCQHGVQEYLGPRYDPDSRFTISVLWAGDAGAQPADRRLLCGLQLLGVGGTPTPFKGVVADLDQSRVWPPGTCLEADEAARRSTNMPVDCAQPHGAQVTGTVSLAERFPSTTPTETDQEVFVREECTRLSDAYLAPDGLAGSGLALEFTPIARASWTAGSRQVACRVASQPGEDWRPLVGSLAPHQSDIQTPAPAPPAAATTETTTTEPSTTEQSPPPVYRESPVPVVPQTSPGPTTTASTPTVSSTPPPGTSAPTSAPPPADPALGPPPGPAPGEPLPPEVPPPNVIQIPGLAPITLPFPAPAPPPPPPPPPAPAAHVPAP
jgi:hypothetical protein